MEYAEVLVTGRVQGVWFRDYVKKNAVLLNLDGWVKNNPDKSVSVAIEGKKEIINNLIQLIKIGSSHSNVQDVQVTWAPYQNNFNSFKIIR